MELPYAGTGRSVRHKIWKKIYKVHLLEESEERKKSKLYSNSTAFEEDEEDDDENVYSKNDDDRDSFFSQSFAFSYSYKERPSQTGNSFRNSFLNTSNTNPLPYSSNRQFPSDNNNLNYIPTSDNINISSKELKSLPPITDPESIEILKKLSQKSSYSSNYSPSWIELLPPEIVSKNAWKFDQLVCQPTKQHLTICSHCKYISKIQKELCPSTMNLSKIIKKMSSENNLTRLTSKNHSISIGSIPSSPIFSPNSPLKSPSSSSKKFSKPYTPSSTKLLDEFRLTREEKIKILSDAMEELEKDEEEELKHWTSTYENEIQKIDKDIPRTFGLYQKLNKNCYLKLPSNLSNYINNLRNLLVLISRRNGYCQGLNFISSSFLLQLNCLRASYITLLSLLYDHYNLNILYESKQSTLLDYMKFFENILLIHNKKIFLHFQSINYSSISYAIEWFTTCFIVSSPGILSYCILDLLMSGLKDGLLKLGLAILDELEDEILIRDFEDLHNDFKELTNKINIMRLMRRVLAMKISENDVLHDMKSYIKFNDPSNGGNLFFNQFYFNSHIIDKKNLPFDENIVKFNFDESEIQSNPYHLNLLPNSPVLSPTINRLCQTIEEEDEEEDEDDEVDNVNEESEKENENEKVEEKEDEQGEEKNESISKLFLSSSSNDDEYEENDDEIEERKRKLLSLVNTQEINTDNELINSQYETDNDDNLVESLISLHTNRPSLTNSHSKSSYRKYKFRSSEHSDFFSILADDDDSDESIDTNFYTTSLIDALKIKQNYSGPAGNNTSRVLSSIFPSTKLKSQSLVQIQSQLQFNSTFSFYYQYSLVFNSTFQYDSIAKSLNKISEKYTKKEKKSFNKLLDETNRKENTEQNKLLTIFYTKPKKKYHIYNYVYSHGDLSSNINNNISSSSTFPFNPPLSPSSSSISTANTSSVTTFASSSTINSTHPHSTSSSISSTNTNPLNHFYHPNQSHPLFTILSYGYPLESNYFENPTSNSFSYSTIGLEVDTLSSNDLSYSGTISTNSTQLVNKKKNDGNILKKLFKKKSNSSILNKKNDLPNLSSFYLSSISNSSSIFYADNYVSNSYIRIRTCLPYFIFEDVLDELNYDPSVSSKIENYFADEEFTDSYYYYSSPIPFHPTSSITFDQDSSLISSRALVINSEENFTSTLESTSEAAKQKIKSPLSSKFKAFSLTINHNTKNTSNSDQFDKNVEINRQIYSNFIDNINEDWFFTPSKRRKYTIKKMKTENSNRLKYLYDNYNDNNFF